MLSEFLALVGGGLVGAVVTVVARIDGSLMASLQKRVRELESGLEEIVARANEDIDDAVRRHAPVRDAMAIEAAKQERETIADWYEETFCGGHESGEVHARGDCAAVNIAAAIRDGVKGE